MIVPDGACPDCRHPWAWHPLHPAAEHGPGCVGRVPAIRLVPEAETRFCPCRRSRPEPADRAARVDPETELELRAAWGDR